MARLFGLVLGALFGAFLGFCFGYFMAEVIITRHNKGLGELAIIGFTLLGTITGAAWGRRIRKVPP
ncbi:MAG: hypothetical protein K8T25_21610 [Planctomycetia bacterium]|nr:hypothetical protein [Planctomycetia bacterium]